MPSSLRNLAVLHSAALVVLGASVVATSQLSALALLAVVFLTPLGPLLFIDRPLMWHMAKTSAYLFAFVAGVWLMYAVFGIDSLSAVGRALLLALLAVYLIGVGGYLKSQPIRAHFATGGTEQPTPAK